MRPPCWCFFSWQGGPGCLGGFQSKKIVPDFSREKGNVAILWDIGSVWTFVRGSWCADLFSSTHVRLNLNCAIARAIEIYYFLHNCGSWFLAFVCTVCASDSVDLSSLEHFPEVIFRNGWEVESISSERHFYHSCWTGMRLRWAYNIRLENN